MNFIPIHPCVFKKLGGIAFYCNNSHDIVNEIIENK